MILNETFKLKKICLSFSSTSFFLTLVQRYKNKNVVYFSNDNKHLDRIKNEIKSIDPQIRVFTLTDFDCSFSQIHHQQKRYFLAELTQFMN